MRMCVVLAVSLFAAGFVDASDVPDATKIRPAMLVWSIGVNREQDPSPMIETITAATLDGRPTWRITHYDENPVDARTNAFDLYDLDRATLAPIRSVMRGEAFELELAFAKDEVALRRVQADSFRFERIALKGRVEGEGPGLSAFVGGLPLASGFTHRYHSVDRWNGVGDARVRPMTLSVIGQKRIETRFGPQNAWEVLIEPDDKTFRIRTHVRMSAPHYPYRVEYGRGAFTLVSEVTTMAFEDHK